MKKEKLICDCRDSKANPIDENHVQYLGNGSEIIVECTKCNRFLKFKKPQKGIPHREEKK